MFPNEWWTRWITWVPVVIIALLIMLQSLVGGWTFEASVVGDEAI